MSNFTPVIGLEIHIELQTKSKMFCGCDADYFGKNPNIHVCPVCMGLAGALPVPNKKAIEWTILIGKALNCKINAISKFDRKHYFYPDLPKGFQISQYDQPIAVKGNFENIRIHRVHLEEDTAKLIHLGNDTLIDFNRSGVPLVEIVTEPDFHNSDDVKRFLEELQVIIRYLGVSDADMEKGSMRLEPNISVAKHEKELPTYKVEVKNINSFRFVKQAIDYEVKRQSEIVRRGGTPIQETRGYDQEKGLTFSQRTKEAAHDYRYFPEPDIPPLVFNSLYLQRVEKQLPELPTKKITRYIDVLKIRHQDAFILTRQLELVLAFEEIVGDSDINKNKLSPQDVANLLINKFKNQLSFHKTTKSLIQEILNERKLKKDLKNFFDEKALDHAVQQVIKVNTKAVEDFKSGKQNAIMFLLGQVMKEMKGRAHPEVVKKKLLEKLST